MGPHPRRARSVMMLSEMESRRQAEVQRQSEIHRHYLRSVAASEQERERKRKAARSGVRGRAKEPSTGHTPRCAYYVAPGPRTRGRSGHPQIRFQDTNTRRCSDEQTTQGGLWMLP